MGWKPEIYTWNCETIAHRPNAACKPVFYMALKLRMIFTFFKDYKKKIEYVTGVMYDLQNLKY